MKKLCGKRRNVIRAILSLIIALNCYFQMTVVFAASKNNKKVSTENADNTNVNAALPKLKLDSVSDSLKIAAYNSLMIMMTDEYRQKQNDKPDVVLKLIKDELFVKRYDESLIKYKNIIIDNFASLLSINKSYAIILSDDNKTLPFNVINFNGKKTFVIHSITDMTSVFDITIYNTYNKSDRQIMSDIMISKLFESVTQVCKIFRNTDIKQYGVFYSYNTQNAVTKDAINFQTVGLITDRKTCEQYINAEITDQNFLDNSVVLSKPEIKRDITRIKLNIQ
jgi:hypothetical protein